jgi:mRNA deadenylase 3'-5' endonuclease subunit Ccr4
MNIHAEMVARRVQMLASNLYTTLQHQNDRPNKTADNDNDVGGNIGTIPYILAGDFNIMPNSSHYQLLTTGTLDENDSTFPPPKYDMKWTVQSHAMDSAYAMMSSSSGDDGGGNDNDNKEGGEEGGGEPEFTNYAHIQDQDDPFIGTLDYIFLSKKEKTTTTDAARSSTSGKGKKDDDNVVGQWWKVNGVSKLPTVSNSGGPFPNAVEPSDHLLIAADLELVSKK